MSALALPITVDEIVDEYAAKAASLDLAIADMDRAITDLETATTVQGAYVERVVDRPAVREETLQRLLLRSGWKAVANRLMIDHLATASDKKRIEADMASPPPLTVENAKATFGDYLMRPRFHILRGVTEVFTSLDPAYKSHSKVKIGVKGLPKRIILNGWGDYGYGYARDKFRDMVSALALLRRQPGYTHGEMTAIDLAHRQGVDAVLDGRAYIERDRYEPDNDGKAKHYPTIDRGITIRKFGNGNAHVFFDAESLRLINLALAEFYGEVLPDAEPEGVKPSASTAVSKDLQFYWTPPKAVEAALDFVELPTAARYSGTKPVWRVLEPSCGDGRILDGIRKAGHQALGIEYHPGRASEARAKGHAVVTANFLEQPPAPDFDAVVMNPPFYGRHYAKHVRHALKFLKPGGTLVAILPATARYDHDELADLVTNEREQWRDLPVASFADAGTNVPTTMLKIWRKV